MARAAGQRRGIAGAKEGANRPAAIEPSISEGASVKDAVTEWRGAYTLRQHGADKECPAGSHQHEPRACANVSNALAQLVRETGKRAAALLRRCQRNRLSSFATT